MLLGSKATERANQMSVQRLVGIFRSQGPHSPESTRARVQGAGRAEIAGLLARRSVRVPERTLQALPRK